MKRFSFFILMFGCVFSLERWIAKTDNFTWYESDFHSFYPKSQWKELDSDEGKNKVLDNFLKQNVAAQKALSLGLENSVDVNKKLFSRFHMLMVNEYYMSYFLESLIPGSAKRFCSKNLKNDVFVKHILINDESLSSENLLEKATNIKSSILSGESFSDLALNHSVDPGVSQNMGVLGWVSIGSTVPTFQDEVFNLCLGCVGVVETDFGVHIVQVDSVRSSRYSLMSKEEYDDYVFRYSSAYIKTSLKDVAAEHDSLLLVSNAVSFDYGALQGLVDGLDNLLKKKKGDRKNVDLVNSLNVDARLVVKYNGDFLSSSWFANKIERSLHRASFYSSVEGIKKDFELMLLRDIVFQKGLVLGLENNFSFQKQYVPVRLGVLEKAYLNYLVSSVDIPKKEDVEAFYSQSDQTNDLDVSYKSIETILLQKKQEQAKESFFNSVVERKIVKVNEVWFNE